MMIMIAMPLMVTLMIPLVMIVMPLIVILMI